MSQPPRPSKPAAGERIAKVLARAGVASRRTAETMIAEGRVQVNGKRIDSPALNVTATDRVLVDGKPLPAAEPARLWLYHKPLGLVTSARDEKGRATVFDRLPEGMPRVMPVGRLDINSEGLLLLTNDGELKRKLELPATGWLRKYRVRVNGKPDDARLAPLRQGITVEGERFQPMQVSLDRQQGANAWLTVGIREGKNREVRRAMEAVGLIVNRLIRTGYGPFQLGELAPGAVEELRPKVLRDQLGIELAEPAASGPRVVAGKPAAAGAAPGPKVGAKEGARGPRPGAKRAADGTTRPAKEGFRSAAPTTDAARKGGFRKGDPVGDAAEQGERKPRSGVKRAAGGTTRPAKEGSRTAVLTTVGARQGGPRGKGPGKGGPAGDAAGQEGRNPRSWGSRSHGGADGAAGGKPRSWGSKRHDGATGGRTSGPPPRKPGGGGRGR